jgi:hypothetical protein
MPALKFLLLEHFCMQKHSYACGMWLETKLVKPVINDLMKLYRRLNSPLKLWSGYTSSGYKMIS